MERWEFCVKCEAPIRDALACADLKVRFPAHERLVLLVMLADADLNGTKAERKHARKELRKALR